MAIQPFEILCGRLDKQGLRWQWQKMNVKQ